NKNLGVISGTNFLSGGTTTFNGKTVVAGDVLVKFTFNGDTDLNGTVDFDDYSHIDNGFNNNRTGWYNGDFDYNGIVDFDDYSLIDQAFNTQGSVVLNAAGGLAGPGERAIISAIDGVSVIGRANAGFDVEAQINRGGNGNSLQAVPEPGTIGLAGVALLGALARRRRVTR
ncbi:MAG: PEP-CTERM sorting domain-containing protein, partial [Anaerolineae bacterium]|nr:PEP-CTERM sorting domain-containing protein [Phycisphaerae bacterium]